MLVAVPVTVVLSEDVIVDDGVSVVCKVILPLTDIVDVIDDVTVNVVVLESLTVGVTLLVSLLLPVTLPLIVDVSLDVLVPLTEMLPMCIHM